MTVSPTPLSLQGINLPCPKCMALPGHRCVSGGGRILGETHNARMRADLQDHPVRRWFAARTDWRRSV